MLPRKLVNAGMQTVVVTQNPGNAAVDNDVGTIVKDNTSVS